MVGAGLSPAGEDDLTRSMTSPLDPTPPRLLRALAGETLERPPVWFMRQAGRSLPEYRALREGTSMFDACFDPEMLADYARKIFGPEIDDDIKKRADAPTRNPSRK